MAPLGGVTRGFGGLGRSSQGLDGHVIVDS